MGKRQLPRGAEKGWARPGKYTPKRLIKTGAPAVPRENKTDKTAGIRRRRRRLTRREYAILLLPVAAALIAVAVLSYLGRDIFQLPLKGEPVQYYGIGAFPIQDNSLLRRTAEDKTMLEEGGSAREIGSLPVYFADRASVVLTQDMVYYAPRNNLVARIPYFTEISIDGDGAVQVERDGKAYALPAGFLYDGSDLYLFLEPMIVSFNGYRIAAPALSYVEAVNSGDVMLFDYVSKDFVLEAPKGAAYAEVETGDYQISLLADSMTDYSEKRTLLYTRPELIDIFGQTG